MTVHKYNKNIFQRSVFAFAVGVTAGGTVGLVGWGGAQVILPSMTTTAYRSVSSVAGYSQLTATGISLTSLSVSTISSGLRFWQDDRVCVPIALAVGLPAVVSARCGSHLAHRLSGDALALFFNGFSIVLIPTHFWIQRRAERRQQQQQQDYIRNDEITTDETRKPSTAISSGLSLDMVFQHVGYGLCSGILSALMGVGGLPLTMSYLTERTHLPHHMVQGTAVCALLPSILVSAATRWNAVPFTIAGSVAAGAMTGGWLGARGALELTETQLRHLYMASLVVFGSRSCLGAARNIRSIILARNPRSGGSGRGW